MEHTIRLYCGKCGAECDYMGVSDRSKIKGFVCEKCHEFNDVDDDSDDEPHWMYATNKYATVTSNIRDGKIFKASPYISKDNGKTIEEFILSFEPRRLFLFRFDKGE